MKKNEELKKIIRKLVKWLQWSKSGCKVPKKYLQVTPSEAGMVFSSFLIKEDKNAYENSSFYYVNPHEFQSYALLSS